MFERLCNPVFVREMRQAVRDRTVLVFMLFHLLVLVAGSYLCLIERIAGVGPAEGMFLFRFLLIATTTATGIVVLLHTGIRLVAERVNEDAMYITTLAPFRIVLGKYLGGIAISALFFSMTLPFFTLAYLLRGVDLTMLLFLTAYAFAGIQMLNATVIAFLAGTSSMLNALLRTAGLLIIGTYIGYGFFNFFFHATFDTGSLKIYSLIFAFYITIFRGLVLNPLILLILGACQLAPPATNRMFILRIAYPVYIIVQGIHIVIGAWGITTHGTSIFWPYLSVILPQIGLIPVILCSLLAMSERCEYGPRVRESIPTTFRRRYYAFPFFTGDCNAFVWMLFWLVPITAFCIGCQLLLCGDSLGMYPINTQANVSVASQLLMYNYCLTATLLWHAGLKRFISKKHCWIILCGLLVAGFFLSVALLYLFFVPYMRSGRDMTYLLLFVPNSIWIANPSAATEEAGFIQLGVAILWFLVLLPILMTWTVRRFRRFTRSGGESISKTKTPEPGV